MTICESYQFMKYMLVDMSTPEETEYQNKVTSIETIAALVYSLPCLALSLRIVIFLFSKKGREDFSSSFYKLFALSSIQVSSKRVGSGNVAGEDGWHPAPHSEGGESQNPRVNRSVEPGSGGRVRFSTPGCWGSHSIFCPPPSVLNF